MSDENRDKIVEGGDQKIRLLELELKREEIKADVKKVIYGTLLLGVAVALFPVVSSFIEHHHSARIEELRHVNSLALQANQLKLDLQKLEREHSLAVASAASATQLSDREFFEDIADEARSARLSDRITIAEFFAYISRDEDERQRWSTFLKYIIELQESLNNRRTALLLIIGDAAKSLSDREAAALELDQIDQRERGVMIAAQSRWQTMVPISFDTATGAGSLTPPTAELLETLLGEPNVTPAGNTCIDPDGPILSRLMDSRDVGPFTTQLITPALDSLERVMNAVQQRFPDLYAEIGTGGGACVRVVRGSATTLSNHSWGTAIDITIGGEITNFNSRSVQAGLVELAKEFAKEGWVWGAHFRRPDGMHFAVSAERLQEWQNDGLLGVEDLEISPVNPDL